MAEAKRKKKRTYEEVLASTKAIVAEKHRKRVEAAAQPGETFAEAENRLKADDAAKERETAQEKARQQAEALAAGRQRDLTKAEAKAKAAAAEGEPFVYYVQVGAFRTPEDAESHRAKLSLSGIETKVSEREQSGRMVYRVRVGPFEKKEDGERAKEKLDKAGLDTALVRVQR